MFYDVLKLFLSFLKIIRCGGSDDGVTLRCQDNSDSIGIIIENAGLVLSCIMAIRGSCIIFVLQIRTRQHHLN